MGKSPSPSLGYTRILVLCNYGLSVFVARDARLRIVLAASCQVQPEALQPAPVIVVARWRPDRKAVGPPLATRPPRQGLMARAQWHPCGSTQSLEPSLQVKDRLWKQTNSPTQLEDTAECQYGADPPGGRRDKD